MARYETKLLNGLIDSYENSLLSRGENKVNIHISYPFTKKTVPEYFNESSLAYEDIHACIAELKNKGFIDIVWKKGKENHIVQKLLLREENLEEVYQYLGRIPKAEQEKETIRLLETLGKQYQTPVAVAFLRYLLQRMEEGKTVREYIDLEDIRRTQTLIAAVSCMEVNKNTCYIREFSIRHFGDSKIFEEQLGAIGKIFRRFDTKSFNMDLYDILAEYSIYHTPNYVYLKGDMKLYFDAEDKHGLELKQLCQGIGLSGEDIQNVRVEGTSGVRKVITIENQTVFFRWTEADSIIIYLGGYHNTVRRELLNMLYRQMPEVEYLHFGDIDVGGFEIYEDLCVKTGIAFSTYHMGMEELKKYGKYAKKLTESDKRRLEVLIEKKKSSGCKYLEVLEYMKANEMKLEQECIENGVLFQ